MTRAIVWVVVAFACVTFMFSGWKFVSPIDWYLGMASGFVLGVICTGLYQSWMASKIATIKLSWWSKAIEVNLSGVGSIAGLDRRLKEAAKPEKCSLRVIFSDALAGSVSALVSIQASIAAGVTRPYPACQRCLHRRLEGL